MDKSMIRELSGQFFLSYIVILCNTENLRAIKKNKGERGEGREREREYETGDWWGVLQAPSCELSLFQSKPQNFLK